MFVGSHNSLDWNRPRTDRAMMSAAGGEGGRPGLSAIEMARQAMLFCKAPASATVEAIERLTEKHVARTRRELLDKERQMIGERDQATAAGLERLTRKIGILSLIPATQRMDLCRRMNLLKFRDEDEPLFKQGQSCIDYYIPIVGAFECRAVMHEQRFLIADSGECRTRETAQLLRQIIIGAGSSLHFEQGVGMPPEHGVLHTDTYAGTSVSTAWPLLNPPSEDPKEGKKAAGTQKRLSISERRAAKRPGGLCIVLAIPMQDVVDILQVPKDEVMLRGLALRRASDFFQEWLDFDLHAVAYMFDLQTFKPGQTIVSGGPVRSNKLYILLKGKIDLQWVNHYQSIQHQSIQDVVDMPCDETMPCMGEQHVCSDYYDGAAPDHRASASKSGDTCEVLVCRVSDILPYLDADTQMKFYRVFQARRKRWYELKGYHQGVHQGVPSRATSPQQRSLDDSFDSRMPPPGETMFARFPPRLDKKLRAPPSKLKYNEKLLQAGGDVASEDGTPRVDIASPVATEEYLGFTKMLPSTRSILPPDSVDDAGKAWQAMISSPYRGRKTFTAPPKYFGETDRKRASQAPEKLPTLIDTNLFVKVCHN